MSFYLQYLKERKERQIVILVILFKLKFEYKLENLLKDLFYTLYICTSVNVKLIIGFLDHQVVAKEHINLN